MVFVHVEVHVRNPILQRDFSGAVRAAPRTARVGRLPFGSRRFTYGLPARTRLDLVGPVRSFFQVNGLSVESRRLVGDPSGPVGVALPFLRSAWLATGD
jgi:hypothetical protein